MDDTFMNYIASHRPLLTGSYSLRDFKDQCSLLHTDHSMVHLIRYQVKPTAVVPLVWLYELIVGAVLLPVSSDAVRVEQYQ